MGAAATVAAVACSTCHDTSSEYDPHLTGDDYTPGSFPLRVPTGESEVAYLEKYLTVLATITNIAPLLGFLGTVVGMILSFEVIATQGLNDPGAVAKGISVALLTTAYGLIVAFFTQPFYNYFTSKVATYTREIETAVNILFETFDEMDRMSGQKSASA